MGNSLFEPAEEEILRDEKVSGPGESERVLDGIQPQSEVMPLILARFKAYMVVAANSASK